MYMMILVFFQLLMMQLNLNIIVELNFIVENEILNSISLNLLMGIFIMCFYIVVYLILIVGNLVVFCICVKNGWKNVVFQLICIGFFNLYIVNFVIVDFLFMQLIIFDVVYVIFDEWFMGVMLCKV